MLCMSAAGSMCANQIRVLFLGNSYTQYNNLPEMIKNAAIETGDTLIYEAYTPGGKTLKQHSDDPNSQQLIAQGNWDYVVIQAQSQEPSFPLNQVNTQVFPYADLLSQMIKEANPCTEILFYTTWGRENGDAINCPFFPPLCTYEGMDDLLTERYTIMAESNDGVIIPVGPVWRTIREQYPNIQLYTNDESHPSGAGSYAAAMTFYSILFNKESIEHPYLFNLDLNTAQLIQNIVNEVAYENRHHWTRFSTFSTVDFNYTPINASTISFENTSENMNNFRWTFGDGQENTNEHVTHEYGQTGDYLVTLTAQKNDCELNLSTAQVINIEESIGILESPSTDQWLITPNPSNGLIELHGNRINGQINILNIQGQLIYSELLDSAISKYKIDISDYAPGIYTVQIIEHKTQIKSIQKIIKH